MCNGAECGDDEGNAIKGLVKFSGRRFLHGGEYAKQHSFSKSRPNPMDEWRSQGDRQKTGKPYELKLCLQNGNRGYENWGL